MTLPLLLAGVFPALVIVAAAYDATSYTIPNWISAALVLAFFPVALVAGMAPAQIGLSALVGVAVLIVGVGAFAMGWIGGGDAKLLAASALWLGWPAVANFLLVTALAGGALAVALMSLRAVGFGLLAARGPAWIGRLLEEKGAAPYGLAIAAGALFAFPASSLTLATQGLAG
ncbi:MAG TPA: prepilin peptidase [Caulobacteraceae bacterium]|jgi:prepilin peptidase CpaA